VHPGKHYLHDQYGITEARRVDLSHQMGRLYTTPQPQIITIAWVLDQIAQMCDNPSEFAWAVHVNAQYLEKNGMLL